MKENDVIKFDNGSYRVVDTFKYKENTYAYLINNDKFLNDVSIVKMIKIDNVIEFYHIEDEEEFNYVLCKFYLNYKNAILDYFK